MKKFFFLTIIWCIAITAKSQDTIFIHNDIQKYYDDTLKPCPVYHFIDSTGKLTLYEIINKQFSNTITKNEWNSKCITNSNWYRFTIKNCSKRDQHFYLEETLNDNCILSIYDTSLNSRIVTRNGYSMPDSLRDIVVGKRRAVTFNLEVGETKTLFLNIQHKSPSVEEHLSSPSFYIEIGSMDRWNQTELLRRVSKGTVLGFLLLMFLYNLALFIKIRQRVYLAFSLYAFSASLYYFLRMGFLFEIVSPLDILNPVIIGILCLISYLILALFYDNIKETYKKTYKFLFVLTFCLGICFLIGLIVLLIPSLKEIAIVIYAVLFLISLIVVLYTFVLYTKFILKRSNAAQYFLIANLFFIIGFWIHFFKDVKGLTLSILFIFIVILVFALYIYAKRTLRRNKTVIWLLIAKLVFLFAFFLFIFFYSITIGGISFIKGFALELGFAGQMLIYALGLADKMQLTLKEKNQSQKELIDQLQVYSELQEKVNIELEQKVRERTAEIEQQKEEIVAQSEEITSQRDMLLQQNKDITDSMQYASFIQQALLTSHEVLDSCQLPNFILYKPRDIISGDFYWFKQVKNYVYFTAADCTGHGVPGAFMSVLGISLLNEIVGKRDLNPPSIVLNELRRKLKKSLKQDELESTSNDGMDISLCLLDLESNRLQFAGAFNPLLVVRNNQLIEYPADRMPVGIHPKDTHEFTNQEIQLEPNDSLYIFSDGYSSQFGGESGKQFTRKRFKQLLLENSNHPMETQMQLLDERLTEWRRNLDQVDDVLVIGLRIES